MRGGAAGTYRRVITRCGWAMLVTTVVVTGCASTEVRTGSAAAVGAAARDYGTLVARTPRGDLLTLEETRPFLVLGFDIRKQPMLDESQFNLTTIHGPCGAAIATPFSATKGFVVYRSTETLSLEAIAAPGDAVSSSFIDALEADVREGCGEFVEPLGNAKVKVTFAKTMALADVGLRRFGFEQRVEGVGSYTHRFVMVVAGGGRITVLVVLSNDQLQAENLNPLLEQAVTGTSRP